MVLDVKKIRTSTGLSQPAFARKFGFNLSTLRDWEQRRKAPQNAARTLLLVIEKSPDAVVDALDATPAHRAARA